VKLILENWKRYLNEAAGDDLQDRAAELARKMIELEERFTLHAKNANHNTWHWLGKFAAERWRDDPEKREHRGNRILSSFSKSALDQYWNTPPPDNGKTPKQELYEIDPALAEELFVILDELEVMKNETTI